MTNILLETSFKIGEKIHHKSNVEAKYIITSFILKSYDQCGTVTNYCLECSNGEGIPFRFEVCEVETDER